MATTLALLQLQNTKGRIEGGEELIKSLAHVILDAHFTAEGLQVLLERIQEFVRVIVLDPTAMPSEAASGPLYLRMWLSSGYLGQIDRIMGGK